MSKSRVIVINDNREKDSLYSEEFDLEGALLSWQCMRRVGLMLGEDPKQLARDLADGITMGRYLRTDNRYQRNATGQK